MLLSRVMEGVVVLLFGIFYFYITFTQRPIRAGDPLGAMGLPRSLAIILVLCGLILIINALFYKVKEVKKENIQKLAKIRHAFWPCLFLVIYTFFLPRIGYIFATILFTASVLHLSPKFRRSILPGILAVLLTLSIYCIFVYALDVRLP